jgi:hypothetical protein
MYILQSNSACSLGLSATSQQYFSLITNQPLATSRNQPAVLFSQNKPAPTISHQPTEQADWYESTLSQSDKDKKVYTISILKYKHSIVHSTHKHC